MRKIVIWFLMNISVIKMKGRTMTVKGEILIGNTHSIITFIFYENHNLYTLFLRVKGNGWVISTKFFFVSYLLNDHIFYFSSEDENENQEQEEGLKVIKNPLINAALKLTHPERRYYL